MEKLVLIIGKVAKDAAQVASEIDSLPGISVTSRSRSMIDVDVSEPSAAEALRSYAGRHGFEVEPMSEAQLIEPISPFKAR
ncbi:hypothetical protein WHT83_11010 [Aminobacter sp. P9b]|uniref:hypothetical protein n=1 Tax=Aminobacter TaxID=31988 RepID=UPI000D335F72|nr:MULTISPECIES: hypothetical protein [Aminobacter]AWC25069.1 hypothetical protein CO731_04563 [Aminobacter sp. MSH1]CAI2935804.1 conserved protein of unknown function [Aminobacter niigataensis]